jgi:Arc/MetJ-type ribon-helix-helix transcriptional regulator
MDQTATFGGTDQPADGRLTPVMVRLAATDLETVDTLVTTGVASSRAEAIRWALARIRKRPAYERLRKRAGEIERLKSEF